MIIRRMMAAGNLPNQMLLSWLDGPWAGLLWLVSLGMTAVWPAAAAVHLFSHAASTPYLHRQLTERERERADQSGLCPAVFLISSGRDGLGSSPPDGEAHSVAGETPTRVKRRH